MGVEKRNHARQKSRGFTLIELSVVMGIAGLMLAGIATAVKQYRAQQIVRITNERHAAIKDAMTAYFLSDDWTKMGHLPCPARRNLPTNNPNYGRSTVCNQPAPAGTLRVQGAGGRWVRIGAVPARDLGLPNENMQDVYGNLFTYAVTEEMAQPSGAAPNPMPNPPPKPPGKLAFENAVAAVDVIDPISGASVVHVTASSTYAMYAIIDHGKDGKGSYLANGRPHPTACGSTPGYDNQNCTLATGTFVKPPEFSTAVGNARHFDDIVDFRTGFNDYMKIPVCVDGFLVSDDGFNMKCEQVPKCPPGQIGVYDDTPNPPPPGSPLPANSRNYQCKPLPSCPPNQLLTTDFTDPTNFKCDVPPQCPDDKVLTSEGGVFKCDVPPNCPSGKLLTVVGGVFACRAAPDCPSGKLLSAVGGDFVCIAPPNCGPNQALTTVGGSFVCTTIPDCPPNKVLSHVSGSGFICTTPPNCPVGKLLTVVGGVFVCQAPPDCPSGQLLSTLGGNFVCLAPPNCGPNQVATINGGKFVCVNAAPAACPSGQLLTSNGLTFVCSAPPTCPANTILNTAGATFTCVPLPNCPPGQLLTNNGTGFSCSAPPDCPVGQVLTSSGGSFTCIENKATTASINRNLSGCGGLGGVPYSVWSLGQSYPTIRHGDDLHTVTTVLHGVNPPTSTITYNYAPVPPTVEFDNRPWQTGLAQFTTCAVQQCAQAGYSGGVLAGCNYGATSCDILCFK